MNRRDKQRIDERRRQNNGPKSNNSDFNSSDASKSLMDSYFQSQQVIQSLSAKPGGSKEVPTKSFKIPKKLPTKIAPNPSTLRNDIRARDRNPPSNRSNDSRRNFERRDMRDELNRRDLNKRRARDCEILDIKEHVRRDDFFPNKDVRRSRSIEEYEAVDFNDVADIPIRRIKNDLYDRKRDCEFFDIEKNKRKDDIFPKRDFHSSQSIEERVRKDDVFPKRPLGLDDFDGISRRRRRDDFEKRENKMDIIPKRSSDFDDESGILSRRRRADHKREDIPWRKSQTKRYSPKRHIAPKDSSIVNPRPRPLKTLNKMKPITLVFFDLSDPDGKISSRNAELLLNQIKESVCKEILSDSKGYLKYMGHKHDEGILSITCADRFSCDILHDLVKEMRPLWPGADLECSPETYEYYFVWLVIPKEIAHISEFLDICKKSDGRMSTEKWRRMDCEENEYGTTCCLEIDVESYELIKEQGSIIHCGDTDIKIILKQNEIYEG